MLGWHVQQQGLTEGALRAFEAERIPRVKEVFGLTHKHAAKMKAGEWLVMMRLRARGDGHTVPCRHAPGHSGSMLVDCQCHEN